MLWLILAFFNAAGLMVLLGAEFIAMLLVIVYVGAVAVLFLFVVMMLDIDFAELRAGFARNLPLGIALALVLLAEIVLRGRRVDRPAALHCRPARRRDAHGRCPTSRRSARCSTGATCSSSKPPASILLVAMIGAIVLTHRERSDVRPQNISAARVAAAGRGQGCGSRSTMRPAERRRGGVEL